MRPTVYRDPVHTDICFSKDTPWDALALELIDTPQVQRLRLIRQLGLAGLVYHGAEHSRFVHTLGVAHLAKKFYLAASEHSGIKIDPHELSVVVASAILHDTGHPPFSHAVEKELGVRHEKVTVHLLNDDTEVRRVLLHHHDAAFVETVGSHIESSIDVPTVDLVSSQLDADRMDYVLRDGYYAGIPNSQYDIERIAQMIQRDSQGFCFDYRAQYAIEGYFMARYHLYLQLYYHKTVRAAEVMLRALIRRARVLAADGVDTGPIAPSLEQLFNTGSATASISVTDADMWSAFGTWSRSPGSDLILSDLSRRLLNRNLFKAIDIPVAKQSKYYEEWLPQIKAKAKSVGLDPDYYVHSDSATDTPYKVADLDPSVSVRLLTADGKAHTLEAVSEVVLALQSAAYHRVRCCVPPELRKDALSIIGS